jgi:hypothetical protein
MRSLKNRARCGWRFVGLVWTNVAPHENDFHKDVLLFAVEEVYAERAANTKDTEETTTNCDRRVFAFMTYGAALAK